MQNKLSDKQFQKLDTVFPGHSREIWDYMMDYQIWAYSQDGELVTYRKVVNDFLLPSYHECALGLLTDSEEGFTTRNLM